MNAGPEAPRERSIVDADRRAERRRDGRGNAVGYLLALALTCLAFAAIRWPIFAPHTAFGIVLALGLVQMVVHFRFFLHVSLAKSSRDDLQLILFSTLIIALMAGGTLVLLFNLAGRMM